MKQWRLDQQCCHSCLASHSSSRTTKSWLTTTLTLGNGIFLRSSIHLLVTCVKHGGQLVWVARRIESLKIWWKIGERYGKHKGSGKCLTWTSELCHSLSNYVSSTKAVFQNFLAPFSIQPFLPSAPIPPFSLLLPLLQNFSSSFPPPVFPFATCFFWLECAVLWINLVCMLLWKWIK